MVFLASILFTGRSSPFSPASYSLQVVSMHWRIKSLPSRKQGNSIFSGRGQTSERHQYHCPEVLPQKRWRVMAAGAWITLVVAGLMETGWGIGLKYTQGFSRQVPSVVTVLFMIGSFYFLPDR
jgi:hypothetical protein